MIEILYIIYFVTIGAWIDVFGVLFGRSKGNSGHTAGLAQGFLDIAAFAIVAIHIVIGLLVLVGYGLYHVFSSLS